jgi:hypothetical protein
MEVSFFYKLEDTLGNFARTQLVSNFTGENTLAFSGFSLPLGLNRTPKFYGSWASVSSSKK